MNYCGARGKVNHGAGGHLPKLLAIGDNGGIDGRGDTVFPDLRFLDVPEHFIPVKPAALRERMLADARLSAGERQQLGRLMEMIAARFHFELREKLERLKALYDPFDPDCDMLPTPSAVPVDRQLQREEFTQVFRQVLCEANYAEMPREQIIACAEHQSQVGLVVSADFSNYAQLQVFCRGMTRQSRAVRPLLMPWRKLEETVRVFARVALLVRLAQQPDGPVFLKLFKNVVAEDLEMLLPYVRIRMRLMDHLKIGTSVVGGLAAAAWKAFSATVLTPWLLLLVAAGFVGAAIRGVFGFISRRTKYMSTLNSNLYFQNSANNASALTHLIDSAETEECKELLLAYYILYVERDRDYTQGGLDQRVEQWLHTEFGVQADLDVADAVRKLAEKNLLCRRSAPGGESTRDSVLKVYDLPTSLRRLDAVWDAYYRYRGELSADEDRLADAGWPLYTAGAANGGEKATGQQNNAEPASSHRSAEAAHAAARVKVH
jgi:hypothetical protein